MIRSLLSGCLSRPTYLINNGLFSASTTQTVSPLITNITRAASARQSATKELEEKYANKIKRYKPRTPSFRHLVLIDRSELHKGRPVFRLTKGQSSTGGRSRGRVTVRSRGGGVKQLYRFIDFKRSIQEQPGVVQRLEYDPNRTSYIALISYPTGELSYILAPQDIQLGDTVESSQTKELEIKPGNCMPLKNIPIGTKIHNIELHPGAGGQMCRSAGTYGVLVDKASKPRYALVALASKEQRYINLNCMATIGTLSNPLHKVRVLGKAGRSRWMGRRPHVRGVAMNPIDHPHGGAGNHTGRPSCSPTGILAKGFKTRDRKKSTKLIVVPRGGIQKGQTSASL